MYQIEEIELPFDKQKNQRRQFCFITFESEEVVDEICKNPKQKIGNKDCDVKKATPKQDPRSARGGWGGYSGFSGYGGRGGGRSRGRGRGKCCECFCSKTACVMRRLCMCEICLVLYRRTSLHTS